MTGGIDSLSKILPSNHCQMLHFNILDTCRCRTRMSKAVHGVVDLVSFQVIQILMDEFSVCLRHSTDSYQDSSLIPFTLTLTFNSHCVSKKVGINCKTFKNLSCTHIWERA